MIPPHDFMLFLAASAALAVAPGPDNLYVLAQSALHGARAGMLVTLGLCTGLLAHIGAVVLGLAALFRTSALAFTALKILGAAYLLHLAWKTFFAARVEPAQVTQSRRGAWALYLRGVLMNVSNPKVALFFLAFLPQFSDPSRGPVAAQIVLLGLSFMLTALLVFTVIALMAGRIGRWLQRAGAQGLMNRVAGTLLAVLAVRLLASRP